MDFGDVALFAFDAGECAGGVNEGDDGDGEFAGEAHEAKGFAVAFGEGAAEVADEVAFGVVAFLCADEHDAFVVYPAEAADDGEVVGEEAVAVDFGEVVDECGDVVAGVWAAGVAGDHDFARGQVGVDVAAGVGELYIELGDIL